MEKNSKKKGIAFENQFIKTINSGAFFRDADAGSDNHVLEIKYREGKGFNITTKILQKVWDEAFDNNKLPMLGIGIKDGSDLWMLKVEITKRIGE